MSKPPEWMTDPIEEFRDEYDSRRAHGALVLKESSIAVVGLARDCGQHLAANLFRLTALTGVARDWRLFINENDSSDNTKELLRHFAANSDGKVEAITRDLGRQIRTSEFAGPRTIELAEYRTECQEWVRRTCAEFEYTIVIDWDAWGGWAVDGVFTGLSYLSTEADSYGMASVSLTEHPSLRFEKELHAMVLGTQWSHYDCWALRLNSYFDDYSVGVGGWKQSWLPLVGSPPVRVCSAFGGFAIYKTADFLRGEYSGQDCEHATFHESIGETTGKGLYLNPSQRTIMNWIESDASKGSSTSI